MRGNETAHMDAAPPRQKNPKHDHLILLALRLSHDPPLPPSQFKWIHTKDIKSIKA